MTLVIQVLAWDKHKYVVGLNQLMESQSYVFLQVRSDNHVVTVLNILQAINMPKLIET